MPHRIEAPLGWKIFAAFSAGTFRRTNLFRATGAERFSFIGKKKAMNYRRLKRKAPAR
jgi:hypothetical protein